ncbi:MAG: DUF47 family protein [Bacteroidota bacterium]
MKLDQWIRKLLPKDEKFYQLLEESTTNLLKGGEALRMLPKCRTQQDRENTAAVIKDIEHNGDSITHRIFNELNSTFVTPIDREDIHLLASALDDVLDHIDGVAARFNLYKVPSVPDIMVDLIEVLNKSIIELTDGVHHLRNLNDMNSLGEIIKKVNDYENQADMIFDRAIADLFEKEKDPITVIKLKEIFVGLETATDKCEDAANVLEGLLIKHN